MITKEKQLTIDDPLQHDENGLHRGRSRQRERRDKALQPDAGLSTAAPAYDAVAQPAMVAVPFLHDDTNPGEVIQALLPLWRAGAGPAAPSAIAGAAARDQPTSTSQASVLLSGPSSMALALLALTLGAQHRAVHEQQQQQQGQQEPQHQQQGEALGANHQEKHQPSQPFGGSVTAHGALTSPGRNVSAGDVADSGDGSSGGSSSYCDRSSRACACGGCEPNGSGEGERQGDSQGRGRSASTSTRPPMPPPPLPLAPPPRFQLLCGPAVSAIAWAQQRGATPVNTAPPDVLLLKAHTAPVVHGRTGIHSSTHSSVRASTSASTEPITRTDATEAVPSCSHDCQAPGCTAVPPYAGDGRCSKTPHVEACASPVGHASGPCEALASLRFRLGLGRDLDRQATVDAPRTSSDGDECAGGTNQGSSSSDSSSNSPRSSNSNSSCSSNNGRGVGRRTAGVRVLAVGSDGLQVALTAAAQARQEMWGQQRDLCIEPLAVSVSGSAVQSLDSVAAAAASAAAAGPSSTLVVTAHGPTRPHQRPACPGAAFPAPDPQHGRSTAFAPLTAALGSLLLQADQCHARSWVDQAAAHTSPSSAAAAAAAAAGGSSSSCTLGATSCGGSAAGVPRRGAHGLMAAGSVSGCDGGGCRRGGAPAAPRGRGTKAGGGLMDGGSQVERQGAELGGGNEDLVVVQQLRALLRWRAAAGARQGGGGAGASKGKCGGGGRKGTQGSRRKGAGRRDVRQKEARQRAGGGAVVASDVGAEGLCAGEGQQVVFALLVQECRHGEPFGGGV